MWILIIIIAIIIGAILGALNSKEGERGGGAFSGAVMGGMGCGYVIFQIFIWGLGIIIIIWLFSKLFS
jgi:hypothetical protein